MDLDPLSTLLLAIGTALDPPELRQIADELDSLPTDAALQLARLVRQLAELRP